MATKTEGKKNQISLKEEAKTYAKKGWGFVQTVRGAGSMREKLMWFIYGFGLATILYLVFL